MRLKAYVAILMLAAIAGLAASLRLRSIAACSADGYGNGVYLGYCPAQGYADYEHGALYFGLVPAAVAHLRQARVLILGNSRTQHAFSTHATAAFFARLGVPFYVLGFGYNEDVTFAQALIQHQRLHPQAIIVNADPFFRDAITPPARVVLRQKNGEDIYERKRREQHWHRLLCGPGSQLGWACGSLPAAFRSAADGRWRLPPDNRPPLPLQVSDEQPWIRQTDALAARARQFRADLGLDPACLLLTVVPSDFATPRTATAVARRADLPLFLQPLPGLATLDHSHLTQPSAERWSAAILERMAPALRRCLAAPGIAASSRSATARPAS